MGFWDIQAFNLAMLAKQAWRLIHHTHSLFYHVYKARYFPKCSFMEAEIGHNPSYVWWSMVAAKEVIMEGSRWRVRHGRQIEAESQNWLSHKLVFRREEWPNLRVGDLIDDRAWEWKRTMIEGIFAPRTCEKILAIPLSRESTQDTLIWKENTKHEFSVKSAHHVALWLNKQEVPEHSQAGEDGKLWRTVWKLNVPPKVRTFLWRACANILPTCDNLYRRRVDADRNCEFCC